MKLPWEGSGEKAISRNTSTAVGIWNWSKVLILITCSCTFRHSVLFHSYVSARSQWHSSCVTTWGVVFLTFTETNQSSSADLTKLVNGLNSFTMSKPANSLVGCDGSCGLSLSGFPPQQEYVGALLCSINMCVCRWFYVCVYFIAAEWPQRCISISR